MMEGQISKSYIRKCQKRLNEWGAPLNNWRCIGVYDVKGDERDVSPDLFNCDLCDCDRVRYVHVMENPLYFESISVGCICAGIMESDIFAAKERDRLMKNREKRRKNFITRQWKKTTPSLWCLIYKGHFIKIICSNTDNKKYTVHLQSHSVSDYKGRSIDNFISAAYVAFDLVDPVERIWNV